MRILLTFERDFANNSNVSFNENLSKWDVQDEIILRFELKKILSRKAFFYILWKMRRSRRDTSEIWIKKNSFSKSIFLFFSKNETFKMK